MINIELYLNGPSTMLRMSKSWIITKRVKMIPSHRKPSHPGEILIHEFLEPMKLSQVKLAKQMNVSIQRINTLINGKRDMTAETAILLSEVLGTTPEFWLNLQNAYDLYEAKLSLKKAA
jgi:addiction module HigA family antidote